MRKVLGVGCVLAGLAAGVIISGGGAMSQSARGTLSATPAGGGAPLTVAFTGHANGTTFFGGVMIAFGDGTAARFCPPGRGCRETTVSHTYKSAGRYTATLAGAGEPGQTPLATVTVTVK